MNLYTPKLWWNKLIFQLIQKNFFDKFTIILVSDYNLTNFNKQRERGEDHVEII